MAINSDSEVLPALLGDVFRFGLIKKISSGDHPEIYVDADLVSKLSASRRLDPMIVPNIWEMCS
jgi:hypothetical protein